MTCQDFEELISDYIDGQLTGEVQSQFAAHLLACVECRSLVNEVRAAITYCKQAPVAAMRPTFETQIFALTQEARLPLDIPALDCAGCEELITDFLDGFVAAPAYHAFEVHINNCEPCGSLLTDTVYAVAACHSVHIEESFEVAESLIQRILAATSYAQFRPANQLSWRERLTNLLAPVLRPISVPQWATAMVILMATFSVVLLQFSDDQSLAGVYRQGNVAAGRAYSWTSSFLGWKESVVEDVKGIGLEVTSTLKSGIKTINNERQPATAQPTPPGPPAEQLKEETPTEPPASEQPPAQPKQQSRLHLNRPLAFSL